MKAVIVRMPVPGPGQVRVKMIAAAVNPVDIQTRSGQLVAAGVMPALPVVGLSSPVLPARSAGTPSNWRRASGGRSSPRHRPATNR